jgi:hypothetical protein
MKEKKFSNCTDTCLVAEVDLIYPAEAAQVLCQNWKLFIQNQPVIFDSL